MKKLTLLFGILLLGISCTLNQNASCQKASKEKIIELLSISEKHTAEGMVTQMSALNDQIEQFIQMVNPEATQEQITAKSKDFIENNQMMKVMIDVLSDYYTDLTEAEVDVLIKVNSEERMLSLNSKVYEVSTSLSTQLEQIIAEAMPTMANGEKMPLIPEPEVSESYKSAFDKYYEISHTDQMLTTVINSIKSLTAALPKDNSNNKEIDSFIDYLSKTTKSLSLRLLVDAASEDDLNYLTEKTSMPEMQKYITCTMGVTQDAMGLAQKIMSNLQASLKIQ